MSIIETLYSELGYQLVGTSAKGLNAFFVRNDLSDGKFVDPAAAQTLYNSTRARCYISSGHEARRYTGQ